MDALLSNRLSKGLGEVAQTFGQYAMAAHEERMQTAKEQFAQMLEQKRQDAIDARDAENEKQRAADKADAAALARQQHQDDKMQQESEFQRNQSRESSQFATTSELEKQRVAIEAQNAARADKAANGDKPATAGEKLTFAQNNYRDAATAYTQAVKDAGSMSAMTDDNAAAAAKANVAAKLQDMLHAKVQMTKIAKASGVPIDDALSTAATPPSAGGPSVVKDAQGNFFKVDSSGKNPQPITRQEAQSLFQQQSQPSTPSTPVSPSADPSAQGDNSAATSPAPATPADGTAGAYAQAQPTVPAQPTNATPPIGQPDNPPLAT